VVAKNTFLCQKNGEVVVDPKDPFANDRLNRDLGVRNLVTLIEATRQPFVFSIEAPWGRGKTTFMRMLWRQLENEGHPCMYFNAWESDFAEDPLVVFLGEMFKLLEHEEDEGKHEQIKKLSRGMSKAAGALMRKAIPILLETGTHLIFGEIASETVKDVVDVATAPVSDALAAYAEKQLAAYAEEKKSIEQFRKHLAEFANLVMEDENKKGPVVILVDELDRCRPDYAVRLLERIKHLFNVENVVFVLAIDRGQIEQSVRAIYGAGMDCSGYLRRFIDLSYRLPEPDLRSFCGGLYERFGIGDIRVNGNDLDGTMLDETIAWLARSFGFSLRVIEQCFTEIDLALRITGSGERIDAKLLAFLVFFKAYRPDLYKRLREKDCDQLVDEIKKAIEAAPQGLGFFDGFNRDKFGVLLECYLIMNCFSADMLGVLRRNWELQLKMESNQMVADKLRYELNTVTPTAQSHDRGRFQRLMDTMDFVSRFQ